VGYDFDAVAALAKRRDFSRTHGSSNLRGLTLYYFLQVFECAVRFSGLPNQFSQGFGIFSRNVEGSHVGTSTAVHRLLTYVSYPTNSVEYPDCDD